MASVTQIITRSDGSTATIVTTQGENETLTDYVARHDATVAAFKAAPVGE